MSNYYSNASCAVARVFSLAILISAAHVASAQSNSSEKSLPQVVVTASRVAQPQTDALPHTTVITSDDIRNSQAVDLPSLLRREAGVQFTQNGGYGQSSGLFVRGAETRQTLILLDGVPLTKQDATGTVSIEHLMLDQIDRIEIVRGNVSSIYGSSGIGGVIQIFTRHGDGLARINVSAGAGSRDTKKLSASVSGSIDGTRYSLSASDFKTEGFSALNPDQVATANPDSDGYRNTSVAGALVRELTKGHELGMRFSTTEGKFDFDSGSVFDVPDNAHTGRTDVDTVSAFSKNRITDNWSSRLSYSESRDRNANRYVTNFGNRDDNYKSKTRILNWHNEISVSPAWTGTAGYERQWQALSSDNGFGNLFSVNRNADSFYVGALGKLDAHQLQFNLRHDRLDRVESATTGYLGYGFNVTKAFKLIGNMSSGFSAPPLGYLYAPFFGNPNLKPEFARSVELGMQYTLSDTLLRATLFNTRTRDQLQYDFATARFDNIARARNRGLELSASGKWNNTDLRASLTLQDPRNDLSDQRLRRRARVLASLAATKTFGSWQFGGDAGYTGSRPDIPQDLNAYWLINLNARYTVMKGLSVLARIDNLLNRKYQTAYGYNQPPRGVFVGLNWQH